MNFEDVAFLFTCNNLNRGIIRQNFDEAAALWKAVKETEGTILEIGRKRGGSTVLLIAASTPDRRIISVDNSPSHNEVADEWFNKKEVKDRLILSKENSKDIKTEELGLLFIDGDHSFEGVSSDIKAHWPQLSIGGLAVFHDAVPNSGLEHIDRKNHCEGVLEACEQLLGAECGIEMNTTGSILVVKKVNELPENIF